MSSGSKVSDIVIQELKCSNDSEVLEVFKSCETEMKKVATEMKRVADGQDEIKIKLEEFNEREVKCFRCKNESTINIQIFQCIDGHFICSTCKHRNNIKFCQICGKDVGGRALGLEGFIKKTQVNNLKHKCHNSKEEMNEMDNKRPRLTNNNVTEYVENIDPKIEIKEDKLNVLEDIKTLMNKGPAQEISFAKPDSPIKKRKSPAKPKSNHSDLNYSIASGTYNWDIASVKSGKFFNEGEHVEVFRTPYTELEDKAIIKFFLTEGGYQFRKGVRIWKVMEVRRICPLRTYQSMKHRWNKLSQILDKYNVTVDQLVEVDRKKYGATTDSPDVEDDAKSHRGSKPGRQSYTLEEDMKIIDYLLQNRRYTEVRGKVMWQVNIL